ncbi:hypothetical protein C8J56DRAFT_937226 [Mycena floridula]|nr:hypothetical protein C8J56DRAFT_937226 [Mycena floridula]
MQFQIAFLPFLLFPLQTNVVTTDLTPIDPTQSSVALKAMDDYEVRKELMVYLNTGRRLLIRDISPREAALRIGNSCCATQDGACCGTCCS